MAQDSKGGWFGKFMSWGTEMIKSVATTDPYSVEELNPKQMIKWIEVCKEDLLTMYKEGATYICVLQNPLKGGKTFVLYRVVGDTEAMGLFSLYRSKLGPLYHSSQKLYSKSVLQAACQASRSHQTWSSAHLAAYLGLTDCFQSGVLTGEVNSVCEDSGISPLHVAVTAENEAMVQELLVCGAQLGIRDLEGNTAFHYAAKVNVPKIIQLLAARDSSIVNELNESGESPLHTACLHGLAENVELLLRWKANPTHTQSHRYPIHCAAKANSVSCIQRLCHWQRDQLHLQDHKYGGTPLHWACSRESVFALADLKCNLDARSNTGETPIHVMIRKDRLDCVMAILWRAADAALIDHQGDNALHKAIPTDDETLVQTLIVFGADVNGKNKKGITPRHLAATSLEPNRHKILYYLHKVGAERCQVTTDGDACNDGCSQNGSYDGIAPEQIRTPDTDIQKQRLEEMTTTMAVQAAMTRSASASGSAIMCDDSPTPPATSGDRVLCMDGGGIRGLVLIQILLSLEKAVGRPIRECFDWVAGTSTGGILALAITHGKPLHYCQGLYFRLKEEVFRGKRPYDSEPLECFMKKEFGETTRMTEVGYPRVMISGVLADRHPAEFHMFRNYDRPGFCYDTLQKNAAFQPPPRPNEQFVWRAARSTGAAPTYFRAMGRFLDGGLMANNPSLDALTEIHDFNMGLKATSQGELVKPIHCVVSLGTGKIPISAVKGCDVFRPGGLIELAQVAFSAKALGNLVLDQVTQAEGRPVDRARAWCSMIGVPFFRFSPNLSEEVELDCTDNKKLVNMLWETQCYLQENQHRINQLAMVLKS